MGFQRMDLRRSLPTHAILVLFMNLVWSESATLVATLRNETDRLALLAFKDGISNNHVGALSWWNDSLHFCKWEGVTCSPRHQRVTVLDLHSQGLVGSVSPYIANLTFLQVIDLHNNSFHSKIPEEIGRLFRLQNLILSNNSFEGEIPTNLSFCSNLRELNLFNNHLMGKIPIELSSLTKLASLRLSSNNLTGNIPPSFGNLSSLYLVSIGQNNLVGSIPDSLGRLANLQFLQLGLNGLSHTIPDSLYNLSLIYIFAMSSNQLHGSIPSDIGLTLPNLQYLAFSGNQFTGPVPTSFSNASGLQVIDFKDNNLSGSVPMNLGSLKDLSILNFGNNQLGTTKGDDLSFFSSLTNCSNLKVVALDRNRLKGVVPYSITNLSTELNYLIMGANQISGTIPMGIEILANLWTLAIEENLLTGTIPVTLGKLQKLQVLALSYNKLTGQIPSSLGNITQLSKLRLQDNNLEGSIPPSLGNFQSLIIFNLSRNKLNGTIPGQVMGLSSLSVTLNFAQNYLSGSIPLEVGSLINLRELDFSENRLSGEIPITIGNCWSLGRLRMEGNFLQGTIPPSLSALRGLEDLDLSRNNLSGKIPEYLSKFPFLQNLNLSFNNLEGEVEIDEGAFKNGSTISIIGNSKLCGGIPKLALPACSTQASKGRKRSLAHRVLILVITVPSCFVLLVCFFATLFWKRKSWKEKKPSSTSPLKDQHRKVSYRELLKATDGFLLTNLIGSGSYGSVYKGVLLPDETSVAIKVLNLQQRGASKSFTIECKALRNIRHRNLVKILTSCSSVDFKGNDFKALVFEFMPNGSLEQWLHACVDGQHQLRNLNLVQRFNIAIDVASALDYLHHHCEPPIVHCDLKPSNVLLDDDMSARVGDFGLARVLAETPFSSSKNQSSTIGVKGTIGYVAPEYGMGSKVTTQGDVYSYGILLLEMFTGRRPTDDMFKDGLGLHNLAKTSLPDQMMKIIDPRILLEDEHINEDEICKTSATIRMEEFLVSIVRIGVACSVESPRDRMTMDDVANKMRVIRDKFLSF